MRLADKIREFVYENYIKPARERGLRLVTIRAGDIHSQMGLKNRMPAVCEALSAKKFEEMYNVKLIKRKGPVHGADVYFTFRI